MSSLSYRAAEAEGKEKERKNSAPVTNMASVGGKYITW
jgi:hypothetical protein